MSFYEAIEKHRGFDLNRYFVGVDEHKILQIIDKEYISENDYLVLISPKAGRYIELMAKKASMLTTKYFGKVVQLYAPLYLSNYCDNECVYCGFKRSNNIERKKLTVSGVENEAKVIAAAGIKHVLVLTGESPKETPLEYILQCVEILKKYFNSISVEIYPVLENEYKQLVSAGVDGLTIYQETYNEQLYSKLHLKGKKMDFKFRLEASERASSAGMRMVNIGALLGLSDVRTEMFYAGLHAKYLERHFPASEIGVSFPRIQPQTGNFSPKFPVNDREFVQMMLAIRLLLPRAGINISTRENSNFRKNLIGLGVTRMSAGSRTDVGGYTLSQSQNNGQFSVADGSSVEDVRNMIASKGYQPVMKDWQLI